MLIRFVGGRNVRRIIGPYEWRAGDVVEVEDEEIAAYCQESGEPFEVVEEEDDWDEEDLELEG